MRLWLVSSLIATQAFAGPHAVLTLGAHHGGSVKTVGQGWLGLFPEALRPVKVKLVKVRDPVDDDTRPAAVMTGIDVSVEGAEQPELLLKGLPPGPVSRLAIPEGGEGTSPKQLGDATLTQTTKGEVHQYVLARGAVTQVLYAQTGGDTDGWRLVWAGDLDHDGEVDLILTAAPHYNTSTTRLFLSSQARKAQLVREVAHLTVTGC